MNQSQEKFVKLNREHAGLGYFDFALSLKKGISSGQMEVLISLLERKGFRCELSKGQTLFVAYDNVIGILKQAEREHIYKKKYRDIQDDVKEFRLRTFLRQKSQEKRKPIVTELEQTVSFNFSRRKEFVPLSSPTRSQSEEHFEDYIAIFTQSELVRIVWALLQAIPLNTSDSDLLDVFKVKKIDESMYMTHRLIDFLRREGILESAVPLHTNAVEESLKSTDHIADYYGHNIGIYFKFMAFYTKWLMVPAIFGLFRETILYLYPGASGLAFELDSIYCIMIVIWATAFSKKWRQYQTGVCTKWNNTGARFKSSDTRFDYKGTIGINPVTELPEYQFPKSKRFVLYIWSTLAHLPLMLFSAFIVILFLNALGYIDPHHWVYFPSLASLSWKGALFDKESNASYIPTIAQSLVMNSIGLVNKRLAYITTSWENHRTHSGFNNSMIFKRFSFEIINTFSPLLYIGFWRLELSALRDELFALYGTDEIRRLVTETLIPYMLKSMAAKNAMMNKKKTETVQTKEQYVQEKLKEIELADYDAFDDYLEMITQFGYITLFATAFPLSGLFSLFFNAAEMKSDSFKLKTAYKRPIPTIVNGIGSWQSWINFMSHLCLATNTILIAYSTTLKRFAGDTEVETDECDQFRRLVYVFLCEHLVFFVVYFIRKKVKAEPTWVREFLERNKKKY